MPVTPSTFFFQADAIRASELALAISDHFGVSVLVHGDMAERPVSGRLIGADLEQAVESLAFLLGVKFRVQDHIWLVGGRPEKTVAQFPSYGLTAAEISPLVREGGGLIAGRVVVESDETRLGEVRSLLQSYSNRPSLTLELFMLVVGSDQVQRVNDWLESLKLGVSYFQDTAFPAVPIVEGALSQQRRRGLNWSADAQALLDFVRVNSDIRVELREQVQVLSGGRSTFESGDVVQDIRYTTIPGATGGQQLVSQIDRRTVGLTLDLGAVESDGQWFVSIRMSDSSLSGTTERTTSYEGERFIPAGSRSYFLLASFTRKTEEKTKDAWRLFPRLAKRATSTASRSVMLIARPVGL